MNNKTRFLIIGMALFGYMLAGHSQEKAKANRSGAWEPLVQSVEDILAGKRPEKGGLTISPEAYLVFGNHFDNLLRVVKGESEECSLNEGPSYHALWLALKVNDPEDAAFLTLKTRRNGTLEVRYHSIVFMKDSSGQWTIQTWHASQ